MSAPEPSPTAVSWETVACPLCGDERSRPMFTASDLLYGSPGEFTLVRCDGCSHVFLNPHPTRDCIGMFYPTDYGPFRGQGSGVRGQGSGDRGQGSEATGVRSWRWLRRCVLWWIDSRAAPIPTFEISNLKSETQVRPRALELGCSHGAFLQQLHEQGWNCIGVEPATEVARQAAERGFDVRVGSLETAATADPQTFVPGSFDAVFAWMVVEHLHDPVATLRFARELLKTDGTLRLSVPNFGCWERQLFGRFWYALQLPTHLQQFTPPTLRRLLAASGFELVEFIHQRNVNNVVGTVGLWLRTAFPRWSLGDRLIRWTDNPSALGLCVLAPLARILAAVKQSGRLTVIARPARHASNLKAD